MLVHTASSSAIPPEDSQLLLPKVGARQQSSNYDRTYENSRGLSDREDERMAGKIPNGTCMTIVSIIREADIVIPAVDHILQIIRNVDLVKPVSITCRKK